MSIDSKSTSTYVNPDALHYLDKLGIDLWAPKDLNIEFAAVSEEHVTKELPQVKSVASKKTVEVNAISPMVDNKHSIDVSDDEYLAYAQEENINASFTYPLITACANDKLSNIVFVTETLSSEEKQMFQNIIKALKLQDYARLANADKKALLKLNPKKIISFGIDRGFKKGEVLSLPSIKTIHQEPKHKKQVWYSLLDYL